MKENKITNEDLARMVQGGFLEIKKDIDGVKKDIGGVREDIDGVKKDVSEIRDDMKMVSRRLDNLERGQIKIIDRLDEKADKADLKKLEGRVEILELKVAT